MAMFITIYQPDGAKLKKLFGDPRGRWEGLDDRKRWYPKHFDRKGRLRMDFYEVVLHHKVDGYVFFSEVSAYMKDRDFKKASEVLFRACNTDYDLNALKQHFNYRGVSMSVGFVIGYRIGNEPEVFMYCDNYDFKEITPVKVPFPFKPGDGATMFIGSDCYPYHITRISESGKTVWIQEADVKPDEENGYDYYSNQVWKITPNPDAPEKKCVRRSNGRYYYNNTPVALGYARYYQDPHF